MLSVRNRFLILFYYFALSAAILLNIFQKNNIFSGNLIFIADKVFFKKNRRICNYLRIKRLFGLHGNWVTRWQPFLFQSSLLSCTNVITLDVQRYNFFMNGQKGGEDFIV